MKKFELPKVPNMGSQIFAVIIGWIIGGVLGAIATVFIIRELEKPNSKSNPKPNELLDLESYRISLLKLSSLLIQVDGNVDENEVKFVRDYFRRTFGEHESSIAFKQLNSNLISDDINILAKSIKKNIESKSYYAILMYLYSIAASDGLIDKKEEDFILKVATVLNAEDLIESIRNQFVKNKSKVNSNKYSTKVIDALSVLGLKEGATKEDIKRSYRMLVKEFHPDKLAGMSDGIIKMAKEKFQQIQSSYEYLNRYYV